jgi:hypothetical protein
MYVTILTDLTDPKRPRVLAVVAGGCNRRSESPAS